jgi:predicted amidophosphoribosyltransferase
MEIILIVWLICGMLAGELWARKGGSAFTGFLIGVVLGPIGVIIALIGGDQRPKCPYCSERIQKGAQICPHCRTRLIGDKQIHYRCPICKGDVEKGAQICPHCGTKFGQLP